MKTFNITNILVDIPLLTRCVKMVHQFNPELVSCDDIEVHVNSIIERVRERFSHKQHQIDPFCEDHISVGPCIQVSFVQKFDQTKREYLTDTIDCVFTVRPIVVSEADDPHTLFKSMTRKESKTYWNNLVG